MDGVTVFLYGASGSLAVDIVAASEAFGPEMVEVPVHYKRVSFYAVRLLLAGVAGCLALAYEVDKPLLAMNIGVTTPLLIRALARGVRRGAATPRGRKARPSAE